MDGKPHYCIEIYFKTKPASYFVYPHYIPLSQNWIGEVRKFSMYKQWFDTRERIYYKKDLTSKFLLFQRLYRKRLQIKKLLLRYRRKLQTGEILFQHLINRLK